MLIRNTLLYMPAQIIGPMTQFIALLLFTHWMAPEPYGVLTYVLASQEFVFFLCVAWWSQYTVRYFGDHATTANNAYTRSEFTIIVVTALAQIVATVFALKLLSTPMPPGTIVAATVYILTRSLCMHLGERARAQGRILDYTIAATAGPLFGFVLAIVVIAFISPTPEAALFAYAVVQLASLIWLMVRQNVAFRLRMPDRTLMRQAVVFGLPLIAAGVASWFGMNTIRILVDRQMGAEAMGLIAVGWGLGSRLTTTVATLVTVAAFPLAVEEFRDGSRDKAFHAITRNGVMMLGIVLPSAVGLYLVQDAFIPLVVAEPFRAMTLAVLPASLVAGAARNMRTHVADQTFILVEKTSMVTWMCGLEAVFVMAGCFIGIAVDGAVGAAIGSALGYTLSFIAGFAIARMRIGLHIPVTDVLSVVAATAIMAIAVILIGNVIPGGPLAMIAVKIGVGVLVYALAIIVLFPDIARYVQSRLRAQPPRSWKKS